MDWFREISTTALGAFLGFYSALYLRDRSREEIYKLQLKALKDDIQSNQGTIRRIIESLDNGFSLESLVVFSSDLLLNNQDLYKFSTREIIFRLRIYKIVLDNAIRATNYCFGIWSRGEWLTNKNLKKENINLLNEKFKMLKNASNELTKLIN